MKQVLLLLSGIMVVAVMLAGTMGMKSMDQGTDQRQLAKATFAGGCFWCMEEAFEAVEGVESVVSGYTGGHKENPTYKEVSAGGTGHTEAIEVQYDPEKVTYQKLLEVFWRNIDPTTDDRQFCDGGTQYRPGIYYHGNEQQRLVEESKLTIEQTKTFMEPIVTEIAQAGVFYPAETYHQDFYKKNPVRYKFYKWNCGRAQRLEELWGES